MTRVLRPLLAGGLAAATAVVLSTGCTDNRASIYVYGVLSPEPPSCTVTNDPSSPLQGRGLLDLSVGNGYFADLLVANQLSPRGEKLQAKAETMRIQLTSAEVTLLDSSGEQLTCDGNDECGAFSVFGEGFISVSRSEEPAYGFFGVQLIPGVVAQSLSGAVQSQGGITVVASVKVFGTTLGGQELSTGEFIYPIDLCYGCLVIHNNGGCCLRSAASTDEEASGCIPGQDATISCANPFCTSEYCDRIGPYPDFLCPGETPPAP